MKNWRINSVLIFVFLVSSPIFIRLVYIQIINHQYWRALAQGQQKIFLSLQGDRGEIFFQDKTPLAINKTFDLVYVSPQEIQNAEEAAGILSSILEVDKNLILEKIEKDDSYEVIKKKLSSEETAAIKNLNLPGIYLTKETLRYYPQEDLASKVAGFLDGNGQGQYGIEGYYEETLQGKEGFLEKEKGPGGYLMNDLEGQAQEGADLILTLDYNIQFQAEKLLVKAKEDLDIESGEIIVMEPQTGKILALADFPNFNPNHYSEVADFEVFQNSAIQKIFEPGSVFKAIVMAAALDQEKITPETKYVDTGLLKIGGYTISNFGNRAWGERTMTEVLEKSINTGAVFAETQIGPQVFLDYLDRFGLFTPTGVDLSGEVSSQNKELKKGYEVNFATASFGQGIEMSPIQLIRAFSAIGNGGKLVKPYIVEKFFKNREIVETKTQIQKDSLISPKTISQLTAMLVNVVDKGTARRAKIPGYYVAGKTGTAQVAWTVLGIQKRGYSEKTVQSFVGFAPAYNAQFAILVKLNNPKASTSEISAVPIFKELAKYIIDLWQIPPDYAL